MISKGKSERRGPGAIETSRNRGTEGTEGTEKRIALVFSEDPVYIMRKVIPHNP